MSDPKQARILLELAERDISALRRMGDPSVFADEVFGFNVQQAVKKLFKAWLSLLGVTYPPVHDLRRLLDMVSSHDADSVHFEALIDYTPYTVQFRYEFRDTAAEALDRNKALRQTEALQEAVCERLTGMEEF